MEDGSGKEGEPKASGAERAGNIDHAASTVNHSEARHTRRAVDTGPALRFGGSKGGLGRAQRAGAEAGCRALEDGSGKEGEPKASGAERAGNIDHADSTVNHSEARHTRQAVDTGPALRFGGSKGGPGASAASWGGSGVPGVGGR